jgi:predicted SprT family Zn-dependent metalloprotease
MLLEELASSYQEGLAYAQSVLDELIDEWGLELTLQPNGRLKSTLGYWWEKEKDRLTIATYCLIDRPGAQILDTVAHEYAHALDFALRGQTDHSPAWREVALLCGARPRARSSTNEVLEYQIAACREKDNDESM